MNTRLFAHALILCAFISLTARAKRANQHYSILGDSAQTGGHLSVNFEPMPGGHVTDHIILNSLTLGITDYFEIGTLPWIYATSSEHLDYALVAKANLYNGKNWQFGLGVSQIKLGLKNNSSDEQIEFAYNTQSWWSYGAISLNFTPQAQRWNVGLTFKHSNITSVSTFSLKMKDPTFVQFSQPSQTRRETFAHDSWNIEANYQLHDKYWIGASAGRSRNETIMTTLAEEIPNLQNAYGVSLIYRDNLWILKDSQFALVHFEDGGFSSLFSTSF